MAAGPPLLADALLAVLLAAVSGSRSPTRGGNATGTATRAASPWSWCWPRRFRWCGVGGARWPSASTSLATAVYGFAHYPDLAMPIAIGGVVGMYSVAAWGGRRAPCSPAGSRPWWWRS